MTLRNALATTLAGASLVACSLLASCSSEDTTPVPSDASTEPDAGESDTASPEDSSMGSEASTLPEASGDSDEVACVPASTTPGIGPSGYALDGWMWTRGGVLFQDDTAAELDGYLSPAAVVAGGRIHLWFARKKGVQHRIHHASSDGAGFDSVQETTGLQGEDIIAYPSVVHDGSRFLMWYGSGTIDLAESQDGVAWTMIASSVLKTGEQGAFDSMTVLYPSVFHDGTQYVMYYTGFDGAGFAIGRAVSPDGTAFTRTSTEPVLDVRKDAFDNHAVAQPCAVRNGAETLVWYGGYDTLVANPGPYRIGLASTQDGVGFKRVGLTLDLEPSGVEAYSTRDPAVVRWQGRWWMAYVGMGDDRRYRIMSATSETCAP